MTLRAYLLAAAFAFSAAPAFADAPGGAAAPASELSAAERGAWREIFAAIRSGDWSTASSRLDGMREGPLNHIARAELYLAKGSPRVELDKLMALLSQAPDLPQAENISRLAVTRGATSLPDMPRAQALVWQGS